MTIASRKTVRERLALELGLAHGANVFQVFPYMSTGFEGKSPVVRVMNGGSIRPRLAALNYTADGSRFRYVIQNLVLFNLKGTAADQQEAEDRLDAMEEVTAQVVSDKDQIAGLWKSITYYDYSEPALLKISAYHYLVETFGLEIGVNG